MGTIVARKRKDGTIGYSAQIVIKREGKIVYRDSQTFDRRPAASIWIDKREAELNKPGGLEAALRTTITLGEVIEQYVRESLKEIGRTKAQVLRSITAHPIAALPCDEVKSTNIVAFAKDLAATVSPSTVSNYISHLAAVFAVARPAWGHPLDAQAVKDAQVVTKRLGYTGKSNQRDRRPTLDELDAILEHFTVRQKRAPYSVPMVPVIVFALFSTRRQEEITRIARKDFDAMHKRVMVRDMKNPGAKLGNDQWCDLPDEAVAIIDAMNTGETIFPFNADTIGAAFTRACALLGIEDLHFHDLRHEGISRLFEMEKQIPHVAAVSGHRSWSSLKRYTHIRAVGDKYSDWKWKEIACAQAAIWQA